MSKIVLIKKIQFSISTLLNSISLIDWALPGATTPGQSGPASNVNEEVLRISQSSSIIVISRLDRLVSYAGRSLGEFYLSAEKQSVNSTALAD